MKHVSNSQMSDILGIYYVALHNDLKQAFDWKANCDPHARTPFYALSMCLFINVNVRPSGFKGVTLALFQCSSDRRHFQTDGHFQSTCIEALHREMKCKC